MSSGFLPLFTVQCRHDYFADGVCRPLKLVPTATCALILARYQLRFRPESGGGVIYYQPGVSPLDQFLETAPLAFYLLNQDPALASYTSFGTATDALAPGAFYFDNLEALPEGEDLVCLNPPGPLMAPQLPIYPQRFNLPVYPPVRAVALSLRRHLTDVNGTPAWQALSPDAALSKLVIAPAALDEGRYQLAIDGCDVLDFWFGAASQPVWGVIAIYLGGRFQFDNFKSTIPIIDLNGQVCPKTYTIRLSARSLPWRYCLIGQSGAVADFDQYELVATPRGGMPLSFIGSQGELMDGRPIYCFVSPVALALAERPGDTLSVVLRPRQGARHAAPMRLGYAQPRNISGQATNERYADVFVHL